MNSFVNYLIESGLSLGIFSLIYFLLLRNETFFKLNRFFLLAAILFSAILPLLHIRIYTANAVMLPEITVLPYSNLLETISVYGNSVSGNIVLLLTTNQWIGLVYLAGLLFFAVRLIIRLFQINRIIRQGKQVKKDGINYVIVSRKVIPFSFLKFVFVSDDFNTQTGWEKMLEHEMEHVRQGHSLDVLVLEILSVFQWFNPFFWMLKRALKENHEFLADKAVVENSGEIKNYKQLLLCQFVGEQFVIANNFNYSLIKKRMKMMSKIKSSRIATIKLLSGILVAIALVVVFACEQKDVSSSSKSDTFDYSGGVFITAQDQDRLIIIDGKLADIEAMNNLEGEEIKSIFIEKDPVNKYVMQYGEAAKKGVIDITLKSAVSIDKNGIEEISVVALGAKDKTSYDDAFFIVDEMPEFEGGDLALRKFIAKSIKYPVSAQENGIQGKVYVNFVVEKDGSIGRTRIARGVDHSIDAEAIRVVSNLPAWKPGKQKGKTVAVSYTIPINFLLQ